MTRAITEHAAASPPEHRWPCAELQRVALYAVAGNCSQRSEKRLFLRHDPFRSFAGHIRHTDLVDCECAGLGIRLVGGEVVVAAGRTAEFSVLTKAGR